MNLKGIWNKISLTFLVVVMTTSVSFAVPEKVAILDSPKIPTEKPSNEKTIKDIFFVGNNIINSEYIMDKILLRPGDDYDMDLVQNDLKNIYKMGYFTERIKAIPIVNPDNTISLKIILEENVPVTDVTIEGNSVISKEEILSYLMPLKGNPQNIAMFNDAIEKIQESYNEKGYVLARIVSFADDPDGVLNVVINEGVINKILITGNEKTKKYVIERNVLTEPGMVYNENQLKSDLVRLYATQAFKDVSRDIQPSEENPDKYDVTIMVQEQKTAAFSIGGGLDSATGIFGQVGISENNFRGLNQRVALNVLAGSGVILNDATIKNHMNIQAELSFFEPYFFNADTSLMSKIFFRDFGSYQIPLAIEQRYGGEMTVAHKLKANKNLSSTFSVGIEKIHLKEGDSDEIAKLYAQNSIPISKRAEQLEGGLFLSMSPGLVYDTRDSVVNTRKGVIASVNFEENLGMDNFSYTHGKINGSIKKYFPVMSKSSLSFKLKGGGKIHGDMPEVMAYRLGGPYTIRGFKMSGVGTGNAFIMGSAELTTPFLFIDRIKKVPFLDNVKLAFFVDAGKLFNNSSITDVIYDRPMQAITAGIGIKVFIPGIGPLSVDYGIPLTNPGSYGSKNGYFTFGVGDMLY